MKQYSLKNFINESQPSLEVIDYVIRTNHQYLLLINKERDAKILLPVNNYAGIKEDSGVYYIHSKKPIKINNKYFIDTFEINISDGDNIIGFHTTEQAINYCDKNQINTSKILSSKLIFSPQLANYLLQRGFKIIHLKPHNATNQTIFVFTVDTGFYETIDKYRKENERWEQ